MNISSKIRHLFFATLGILHINATIYAQQESNQKLQQFAANMPMPSEEEIQEASAFLEEFFTNMSDEEMADFMQFYEAFVQDIESGKIKVEDIFGPLPEQPPVTPQEQKKPEPQKLPEVKATPVVQDNLKDKKAAAEMVKKLIASITSLKTKAASSHKVLSTLEPLSKDIDTLVYYLYALEKPEHIQQLISDKELSPLHDHLKSLQRMMEQQEPLITIPEFGLGTQKPQEKEASKKALSEIIAALNKAFSEKVLKELEKLFEKYEPEILKQKKSAEEAEERAKKELATMKGWRQEPARITPEPRERSYPTRYSDRGAYGGRGHQDYGSPYSTGGYAQPSRQFVGEAPSSLPPAPKTSTPQVVGSQTHQPPAPPETKAPKKPEFAAPKATEQPVEDHLISGKLADLKEALTDASRAAQKINEETKNDLPMYLIKNSTTADEKLAKKINKEFATCIESLRDAKKYKKSVEARIKSAKRSDYTGQLNDTLLGTQGSLKHLYDSLYNALGNYTPTVQARHMGYEIEGIKQLTDANLIETFQELYEELYNPQQKEQRKEKSKKLVVPERIKTEN